MYDFLLEPSSPVTIIDMYQISAPIMDKDNRRVSEQTTTTTNKTKGCCFTFILLLLKQTSKYNNISLDDEVKT